MSSVESIALGGVILLPYLRRDRKCIGHKRAGAYPLHSSLHNLTTVLRSSQGISLPTNHHIQVCLPSSYWSSCPELLEHGLGGGDAEGSPRLQVQLLHHAVLHLPCLKAWYKHVKITLSWGSTAIFICT